MTDIDFTKSMLSLKGTPLMERLTDGTLAEQRLGDVIVGLVAVLPSDKTIPASERRERFVLSVKIMQAEGPLDLSPREIGLLRAALDKSELPDYAFGQLDCILEGKPNPLETVKPPAAGKKRSAVTGKPKGNGQAAEAAGPPSP